MKFPFIKPTIVILHGWNLSGERFAPLAEELAKLNYRVFTPDLPGFGKEDAPPNPWRLSDYADFMKQFIDKNKINKVIFVGHSFGGRVSLKYQKMYPKNVAAIILSGTPGFTPIPKKRLLFFMLLSKIGGLLFKIPPLNLFQDWARRWYYYAVGARDYFRAEGTMRQTFKNIIQEDLSYLMESVMVPCLLLWGEYDVVVPSVIAQRMKDVIPMATVKIIPEADHGVPFKKPDVFAQYIDAFLKKL